MPPIPSARSSAMSMKSSSSRESNEYLPIAAQGSKEKSDGMDSGLHVIGETGYLELNSTMRKKSDTKKLPKISKPKNKGKGTKRKKIKEDNDTKMKEIVTEENKNRTDISRKGGEGNSVDQASTGEEDADYYGKYGLDPRRQFSKSRDFRDKSREGVYGVGTPLPWDDLGLFKKQFLSGTPPPKKILDPPLRSYSSTLK